MSTPWREADDGRRERAADDGDIVQKSGMRRRIAGPAVRC